MKAFADNKCVSNEEIYMIFDAVKNTVGKGENAGYQHFLLFLLCFQMLYVRVVTSSLTQFQFILWCMESNVILNLGFKNGLVN